MGVEFVKRPNDGSMKGIAFIKDPDGYWVEIFAPVGLKNVILEHASDALIQWQHMTGSDHALLFRSMIH